jgi:hypothetical protein
MLQNRQSCYKWSRLYKSVQCADVSNPHFHPDDPNKKDSTQRIVCVIVIVVVVVDNDVASERSYLVRSDVPAQRLREEREMANMIMID